MPLLHIRSFSNDQFILDKVFYANFYRIKSFQKSESPPTILDIGAHCGYFSFAAIALGAKKVYAFEPFSENYKMLLKNLSDDLFHTKLGVEVIPYQMGIYTINARLTFGYPELQRGSFFDFAEIGEHANIANTKVAASPSITLDNALENYIGESIDILKISIGYAEIPILLASQLITTKVAHICGESSIDASNQSKFELAMAQKGFPFCSYYDVPENEGKVLFHFSKTKLEDAFESK